MNEPQNREAGKTTLPKLIATLCPDGVEFKTLGEIAEYQKERIDASEVNEENYVGVDNLLPDKRGKIPSKFVPEEGRLIRFESGDILIGNIRPYFKKIWLADLNGGTNGDILAIHIKDKTKIDPRFLFQVLGSDRFFAYDVSNSKGAAMPRGDKAAVLNYKIPLPPTEVQHEIARILDKFTELIELLEKELIARKKQYEYYRNKLLTFSDDVPRVQLGEIAEIVVGGDVPKDRFSREKTSQFNVPIFSNGVGESALYGFTDKPRVSAPSVTISARGTIGYCSLHKEPFFPIVRLICAIPHEELYVNYLKYFLDTVKFNVPKTGIPQLTAPEVAKTKIPLPPLSEQKRIAGILDRFDSLCNDLSGGIPAEIAAREKQYEYYRDRLLTFREKTAAN